MIDSTYNIGKQAIRDLLQKSLVPFAVVVGLIVGFVATLLESSVHKLHQFLLDLISGGDFLWINLVLPMSGILLTVLFVTYIVKIDLSHGVTKVLLAISQGRGQLSRRHTWASLVSSILTVGFGASLGLEAPIVLTGAAIGSMTGRLRGLDERDRKLLILCGAAAAVSGIYKAPVAGILFTFEVLLARLALPSVVPILTASLTATIVSQIVTGSQVMFPWAKIDTFIPSHLPWFIILGLGTGILGIVTVKLLRSIDSFFKPWNWWQRLTIAGLLTALLIFLVPPLFGQGFTILEAIAHGDVQAINTWAFSNRVPIPSMALPIFLLIVMIGKILTVGLASASGGVGGVFAPSLFLGGVFGFFLFTLSEVIGIPAPFSNTFIIVGMAGVMAAIMHAPLSASFLIAEITGGYQLLVPLLLTSALAYFVYSRFEAQSIYAQPLENQKLLQSHNTDTNAWRSINFEKVVLRDYFILSPGASLETAIAHLKTKHWKLCAIMDQGRIIGILDMTIIARAMVNHQDDYTCTLGEVMERIRLRLPEGTAPETIATLMEQQDVWYLALIDQNGACTGLVTRTRLLQAYQKVIRKMMIDQGGQTAQS